MSYTSLARRGVGDFDWSDPSTWSTPWGAGPVSCPDGQTWDPQTGCSPAGASTGHDCGWGTYRDPRSLDSECMDCTMGYLEQATCKFRGGVVASEPDQNGCQFCDLNGNAYPVDIGPADEAECLRDGGSIQVDMGRGGVKTCVTSSGLPLGRQSDGSGVAGSLSAGPGLWSQLTSLFADEAPVPDVVAVPAATTVVTTPSGQTQVVTPVVATGPDNTTLLVGGLLVAGLAYWALT